ncbi:MAG: ADP-ribosylglycohydrolase family protein [Chloroflexi bacterium]|nr:ADP-ribosylglycohydrolase family protein [Chloroflexota bacterium]
MNTYQHALTVAIDAAIAAGDLLRQEFHRPGGPRGKRGHADVDIEAERIIRAKVLAQFGDFGYLGEETGAVDPVTPSATRHVWLVDPNDGTDAFVRGARGHAVSIALLRDGVPVLGVVYAPTAPDDGGDLFAWAEGCGPLKRNGSPIEREPWLSQLGPYDISLLARGADLASSRVARNVAPGRYRALPSIAYRLALAAAGDASAAASLAHPVGWDYAAGHALIRAVGGVFVDERGLPIAYSRDGHSAVVRCFGGAPSIVENLVPRPWDTVFDKKDAQPEAPFALARLEPGKNIANAGLLRRAQGCLLGQIAGDNLGGLVEFQWAAAIRRDDLSVLRDGGVWRNLAGQPTDDSEMALCLARAIAHVKRYDPEAAAHLYYAWYRSHPFDIGNTTATALEGIREADVRAGEAALAASRAANASSQANGSLMRISPLGIAAHSLAPDQAAEMARRDSALTHPHVVCQESCAVYAVAIANAVASGGSSSDVYRETLAWAQKSCRAPEVITSLEMAATEPPVDYLRQQGWVLVALQNAFYQLLYAPTLKEGVVDSVCQGGDTDTNAAIAGALLGAVHGREAVPPQWRQMVLTCRPIEGLATVLHPRPRFLWPVDALELAEKLLLVFADR